MFVGFGPSDISNFHVYERALSIFSLWVLMPVLGLRLNLHESLVITVINFTVATGKGFFSFNAALEKTSVDTLHLRAWLGAVYT